MPSQSRQKIRAESRPTVKECFYPHATEIIRVERWEVGKGCRIIYEVGHLRNVPEWEMLGDDDSEEGG